MGQKNIAHQDTSDGTDGGRKNRDAKRFRRLALLRHGVTVIDRGNGGGSTRNSRQDRTEQSAGGSANVHAAQENQSRVPRHNKGNREEQS